MVSVSKPIPYQEIVDKLSKGERLAIVSCNSCANYCRTGGRKAMASMSSSLAADGFNVVASEIVCKACILTDLEAVELPEDVDAVLMMACVSGCRAANKLFRGKRVVASNVTLGIGYYESSKKGSVLVSPYPGFSSEVGKVFPGCGDDERALSSTGGGAE